MPKAFQLLPIAYSKLVQEFICKKIKTMKNIIFSILAISLFSSCSKYMQDSTTTACGFTSAMGNTYAKKDSLEKLMTQYVQEGIPGLTMVIYTPTTGYWGSSAGFAKIETKTPMQICHLQYLQSVSKTYLATAILKLQEEGKIDLDAPITQYLPEKYIQYINNASTMRVRNLLNHTSGMPDYLESPVYITYVLQHPDHYFTSEEFLSYIKNKKQQFAPGSKFEYSNSNYHVLALIVDAIIGSHDDFIKQEILAPLELRNTFYRNVKGIPSLVNSYMDRFSTGIVENVSQLQQESISCAKGDDGMIATPMDAINFLKGLMEGKLLTDNSLKQMKTCVIDQKGNAIYGLGLYHVTYFGVDGYGHGGAGAGAGCGLYYFPSKNLYIFLGTNIGTLVDGPIVQKVNELKTKVLELVLKN